MTWERQTPQEPGGATWLALSGRVLVRTSRHEFEPGAPKELASDAGLFRRVVLELLVAHDLTDEEIGGFVRAALAPLAGRAVGRWKWTRRCIANRRAGALRREGMRGHGSSVP